VALLLSVPGGSRTILEAIVPYHDQSLIEFLGRKPEQFCSAATAEAMAERAYNRAAWLAPGEEAIGLGCTASLISDCPKKGDHRIHVATRSAAGSISYSITLEKGARDREGEEQIAALLVLNALAETAGIGPRIALPLLPGEMVHASRTDADPLAVRTWPEGKILCQDLDGKLTVDYPRPAALLAGSFNPVHEGHWQLAGVAATEGKGSVAFELSATNVDKPPMGPAELRRRLTQFVWRAPIWVTRAPTFLAKAELFPGVLLAIGADTAARLVDPKYYDNSPERMLEALVSIRSQGCRFLVAGREDDKGRFIGVSELEIPTQHADLFTPIPESLCRIPTSSTALRKAATS
jgi:hypothetical protein